MHDNIQTKWEATPDSEPDLVFVEYIDGEWDDPGAERHAVYSVRYDHRIGEKTNQPGLLAMVMLESNTDRLRRPAPQSEEMKREIEDEVFRCIGHNTSLVW